MRTQIAAGRSALPVIPFFVFSIAFAASASAGPKPENHIIVTATRTEIPLENAIVPVTVITRQDIEQSLAADLAELLRFEAGIDIGRNGGPGQSTSVFLRGSESNHTLVLVDGVRINPGTIGGAAIQHIAPETIERIEIVKGARSALFGTDAIGGVVNIITRQGEDAFVESSVGTGSFGTRSVLFSAGRRSGTADLGLTLNWQDTDGFSASTASDAARGYDNLSASFRAGRQFASSYVSFRHWRASGTNEYFDFFLSPLDQDFRVASTALEVKTSFGSDLESKLVLSHINDSIEQNQSIDFVESKRYALDWQVALPRGNHEWVGGIYLVDENASSESFGSGFDEATQVRAVFVEDQWSQGVHRTFLAARLSDHEAFGNHFTWNAEYSRSLGDRWTVNAGVGHAFRAPDATDRFGFGGRPDLDPEAADEMQAGLRYRPDARHTFDLELYRNDIDDLIEFDLSTFELRNIGKAEIRGAELGWEYRGDSYSIRTAIVRQSADNAIEDVRLVRRAEESMTVNIQKDLGNHRLGLSLLASGDREDVGDIHLPGYVLANLTGQFAISDRWRLNARIENILDRDYETAAGFRMQERSFFADLGYSWP
ncbi:MAG TPA: TonB-dependent receptor [Woeseiaceae bacterium]|nr:TonB-dependent receptor [Woeseiaceae bacterium]